MKIVVEAEARRPEEGLRRIIEAAREKISPDGLDLEHWYGAYSKRNVDRWAFDLGYLIDEFPHHQECSVLELGCSPPVLTAAMHSESFLVTGVDVHPDRFKSSIKANNLKVVQKQLGSGALPFSDSTFDAVVMNEIFEHLNTDLIGIFEDILRVLKSDGRLFLSTPNLKSFVGLRNYLLRGKAYSCCGEIYEEYGKLRRFGHMGHVREYTQTEVVQFLSEVGFKTRRVVFRGKFGDKYRLLEWLYPAGKPFFSIIAEPAAKNG